MIEPGLALVCSRLSSPQTRDRCMASRHAIPFVPLPGSFSRQPGGKGDTLYASLYPRPSDGPLASVCLPPISPPPPLRMGSTFGHTGKFGVTRDVRFHFCTPPPPLHSVHFVVIPDMRDVLLDPIRLWPHQPPRAGRAQTWS